MHTFKKNSLMYGSSYDSGHFMKNFRFDTIWNHKMYRDTTVPVGSLESLL